MAGGIVAVELYKARAGITVRTGARFALPLAIGVAVGRFGCFFAGLDDFTYGTPTTLPWGVDFGDGVSRHPVQLYESARDGGVRRYSMSARAPTATVRDRHGFYLAVGFYGLQRFVWEFLKPYPTVIGPFNLVPSAVLGVRGLCGRR